MASAGIVCHARDIFRRQDPDKIVGPKGKQARMWIRKIHGRQVVRIEADAGFDWCTSVRPLLPTLPSSCPSTHLGYLETGEMRVRMDDGTAATVRAGETYFIPPGHVPEFPLDTVMLEFSQDTTYTDPRFAQRS